MKRNKGFGLEVAAMVVAAGLLTGCASTGRMAPAGGSGVVADTAAPASAATAAALLNVQVGAREQDPVSVAVRDAVKGRLTGENFQMAEDLPDLRVTLDVTTKPFDQSGNYWVFDGQVDASVTRMFDQRLLGRETLTARGERKLGKEEAQEAVGGALASKTASWVAGVAASGKSGLAANDITIRRYLLNRLSRDDAEYARFFISRVAQVDGVVSCVVASQDYATHTVTFRVVYYAQKFPEGLLNRLAAMDDLGIKPAQ